MFGIGIWEMNRRMKFLHL